MRKLLASALLCVVSMQAMGQTVIECTQVNNSAFSLWPGIYLSKTKRLCFNVKGWMFFRGENCVSNGGTIQWHAIALISDAQQSYGRDNTDFRVQNAVVTDERLEYVVEWRRNEGWRAFQRISIDRLTGTGVSYFIDMHGGESLTCRRSVPRV